MAEKDLVGKKKIVVNESAFFNMYRSLDDYTEGSSFPAANVARAEVLGGLYLPVSEEVDKVRAFLGRSWDHRKKMPHPDMSSPFKAAAAIANEDPKEKVFDNKWGALKVFRKNPIELVSCGPPSDLAYNATTEKIVLKCHVPFKNLVGGASLFEWLYFMKTGVIDETGVTHSPTVKNNFKFQDHYHETYLPFTPNELATKQPVGKAYFAEFNTFYNPRVDSLAFEKTTGVRNDIQNSMPTPYAFLKLTNNEIISQAEFVDLKNLLNYITPYYNYNSPGNPNEATKSQLYNLLLKTFPLETLATLYGAIGGLDTNPFENYDQKIIEKLVTLNYEKHDVDGLFESYFTHITKFFEDAKFANYNSHFSRITGLENKFRTLIFSPSMAQIADKVEKYKNNFPFGIDISFNAKLFTSLGDTMKQLHTTKFMSHALAAGFSRFPQDEAEQFKINLDQSDTYRSMNAIDYTQEDVYKTGVGDKKELEYSISPYRSDIVTKNFFPITDLVWNWLHNSDDGYYGEHLASVDKEDIRNYTTFLNNSLDEPSNLDDPDNVMFKKLFGTFFEAKINDIYSKKKRSFADILAGKPAYTEDIFYRIKKERKLPNGDFETVQNVLIPNTSELDIVKYVDTQVKYHTFATYKYTVYAERVVFGSLYQYNWIDPSTGETIYDKFDPLEPFQNTNVSGDMWTPPEQQIPELSKGLSKTENVSNPKGQNNNPFGQGNEMQQAEGEFANMENPAGSEQLEAQSDYVESVDFYANLEVLVQPSIRIIEDKIFETPEVMIMDRPPVPPDVNIVPYRAINNRLKMLITSNVDRYTAKPVLMLAEDEEIFDQVKKSQFSPDGKVEFSSDDPTSKFQIFRTRERPSKYSDFELYKQIDGFVFEESILPNTKYYYTFRAVDSHGLVSNPTEAYEVELIDEKGAVKPIIRLISMELEEKKTNTKECQKYIYIKPSLKQIYFSEDPEVDGVFSQKLKKKKYKMRLTSKGSGKKIDINFSFRKTETV